MHDTITTKETIPIRRSSRLLILDADERLLLFHYQDEHSPAFWATVGGELVGDESYRQAAERELQEETGIDAIVGERVWERDDIYAVARSSPARWLEQYFVVYVMKSESDVTLDISGWTEEEQSTIQKWKWWELSGLRKSTEIFKPECIGELLKKIMENKPAHTNPVPSTSRAFNEQPNP